MSFKSSKTLIDWKLNCPFSTKLVPRASLERHKKTRPTSFEPLGVGPFEDRYKRSQDSPSFESSSLVTHIFHLKWPLENL
ncbi:hypothetical protein Agabi119p4_6594 [Agaricus bisporus var. burnettii]|uniref:Uncharacterized protein n=1 Tax=Agaricus bisporus var. burnettii TaxID=192524 RepID=A0A8H7F030_AGABI|nr:hypothetical protein Agabi119p4_6594 [Agaricus bisporus var. burnettii]